MNNFSNKLFSPKEISESNDTFFVNIMQNISTEHFEIALKNESKNRFQKSQDELFYPSTGGAVQSFHSMFDQMIQPETSFTYNSYNSTQSYQNQPQKASYNYEKNDSLKQDENIQAQKDSTHVAKETKEKQPEIENKVQSEQQLHSEKTKKTSEQLSPEIAEKAAKATQKAGRQTDTENIKQTLSQENTKLAEKLIQENGIDKKINLNAFSEKTSQTQVDKTIQATLSSKTTPLEKQENVFSQKTGKETNISEDSSTKEKADLLKGSLGATGVKTANKNAGDILTAQSQSKEIFEKALHLQDKKSSIKSEAQLQKNQNNQPEQVVSRETIQSNSAIESGRIDLKKQEGWKPESIIQYRSTESLNKKINTENLSSKMESNLDFQNNSSHMNFDKLMQTQKNKENPVLKAQVQQQIDQMFSRARVVLRENGNANLTTNLYPKELGKISIRLALVDGKLTGHFVVDNEVVQKELNQRMEEIIKELKDDGYEVSQFHVNVRSENSEQEAKNTKSEPENINRSYQSSARPVENSSFADSENNSRGLYA